MIRNLTRLSVMSVMILVMTTVAAGATGFVEPEVTVLQSHFDSAANNYGWVGADLGDLNGDGLTDYGVSAITDPTGGSLAGKLYIYSGADGSTLHSSIGATGELYGYSLSTVGDVDGDGTPDYAVGAPGIPGLAPGRAIVYSGADHTVVYEFTSSTRVGTTVADAGDLNDDGVPDILIGDENASATRPQAGNVTVYSGADGSPIWSVDGAQKGDLLGSAGDSIDDVDQDGTTDIVAGAYGANGNKGEALVLSGADGSLIHELKPVKDGLVFARFFARGTPDIDGDGTGDIFVADYSSERGGGNMGFATGTPSKGTGTAYVFSGATGSAIHVIEGAVEGEGLGPGRAIPDTNGDGIADLLIAAYSSSEGAPGSGTVRIYSGADASVLRTMTSTTAGEFLGVDALGVDDLNGDGIVDYLLTGFGSDYVIAGTDLS